MVFKFSNLLLIASAVFKTTSAIQTFDHCVNPGEIALTFNDGPSLETTNDILDILDQENVKATFFVSGKDIDLKNNSSAKDIIEREYKSGHIIASHTYSHPMGISSLSSDELKADINELADTIYDIIGVKPAFFRPPHGEFSSRSLEVLEDCNISANILWNLDSEDWNSKSEPFTQYVSILGNIDPSVNTFIALHHDDESNTTVDSLTQIISYVKSLGYRFVTMDECIGMNPYQSNDLEKRDEENPPETDTTTSTTEISTTETETTTTTVEPTTTTTTEIETPTPLTDSEDEEPIKSDVETIKEDSGKEEITEGTIEQSGTEEGDKGDGQNSGDEGNQNNSQVSGSSNQNTSQESGSSGDVDNGSKNSENNDTSGSTKINAISSTLIISIISLVYYLL